MTKPRVTLLDDSDAARWDSLVAGSAHGTFYHGWAWIRAIRTHMPDQDVRIYGCFAGDELVGGCVLRAQRRFGLKLAVKPWASLYCGMVFREDSPVEEKLRIRETIERLLEEFDCLHLVHGTGFSSIEPFEELNGEVGKRETLIVATGGEDVMWEAVTPHARNAVRRARRLGVTVEESDDTTVLSRLYWLSYERQGIPIHFRRLAFERVCEEVIRRGLGKFWVALDADRNPCSAVLMGWDTRRAYGLLSGTDYEHSQNGSGSLVWWEILRALAPRFREVDMVGCGTPGIHRFKRQFRPALVTMFETRNFKGFVSRAQWKLFERLRAAKSSLERNR